jgi:3-Ketosteroid 9alpha-hydroxylase C-terminal domain
VVTGVLVRRSCPVLRVTPIDGEYVEARYTFVLTEPETGEMTRMGLGLVRDFCKQIEQDIPIWENNVFRDRPQTAPGESAITKFRAWGEQSYERDSSEEPTLAS